MKPERPDVIYDRLSPRDRCHDVLDVPLILIATAMLASHVPARRATRVEPVVALRDE